jgi:hypothetical protein
LFCDQDSAPLPGIVLEGGRQLFGRPAELKWDVAGDCRDIRVWWWNCGSQRKKQGIGGWERSGTGEGRSVKNPTINEPTFYCAKISYRTCHQGRWVRRFVQPDDCIQCDGREAGTAHMPWENRPDLQKWNPNLYEPVTW